jgi:hypothetical protein
MHGARPDPSPPPVPLEAVSFLGGDVVGDKMVFTLTLVDAQGAAYRARFYVRNHYVGMVHKAIRRLLPVRLDRAAPATGPLDSPADVGHLFAALGCDNIHDGGPDR